MATMTDAQGRDRARRFYEHAGIPYTETLVDLLGVTFQAVDLDGQRAALADAERLIDSAMAREKRRYADPEMDSAQDLANETRLRDKDRAGLR